jgi:DNA-binding NarL/FixJ family response regulator
MLQVHSLTNGKDSVMIAVLIVEDHNFMGEALVRLIKKRGNVKVTRVRTAEEALTLLSDSAFDLLFIDISLPGMDGIELAAIVREKFPNTICLMLSGYNTIHYLRQALNVGARGYLIKDDPEEILDGLEHVLNGEIYISHHFNRKDESGAESDL